MAQVLFAEQHELSARQLANPHFVESWKQLLRAREIAERQRRNVYVTARPVVETMMDVEVAAGWRRDQHCLPWQAHPFGPQAHNADLHATDRAMLGTFSRNTLAHSVRPSQQFIDARHRDRV